MKKHTIIIGGLVLVSIAGILIWYFKFRTSSTGIIDNTGNSILLGTDAHVATAAELARVSSLPGYAQDPILKKAS